VLEPFQQEFPDRFLNVGVAEQNMTGVAAGLAMEGYTVFTYSIANFPTLRCIEQIRYDVCYHDLNVKIIAVGGGYAYASLGASHHATEDFGMLRTIPNLTVCAPGDPIETQALVSLLTREKGPAYVRLGKAGEPKIHSSIPNIEKGEPVVVRKGKEKAVFSTGAMLKYAYDYLNNNDLQYSLYSFPFIKPINGGAIREIISSHQSIVTIEEHQKSAGFGSAILEVINDLMEANEISKFPSLKRIAIPDQFVGVAGTQEHLRGISGLFLPI